MTEEQANKAKAQTREFPETMEIMGRIRGALAAQLFMTKISEAQVREDLYLRVQTLDAMQGEMAKLLAEGASETAINEYVKTLATTAAK